MVILSQESGIGAVNCTGADPRKKKTDNWRSDNTNVGGGKRKQENMTLKGEARQGKERGENEGRKATNPDFHAANVKKQRYFVEHKSGTCTRY